MIQRLIAAAALVASVGSGALAQPAPEVSYGIGVTSNYIDRGTTQSDDDAAVQGYVEGSYGLFYGGVWASTVELEDDRAEFDLYAGIRPTVGDFEFDVNYTRYVYDDSGDCCGEIGLGVGYPVADFGELGAALYVDPDAETSWFEAAGSLGFFEVYEVGGTVGTDFGSLDLGDDDKVAWDIGVGRSLGDIGSVDLRYHDSNYDPGRAVVSIGLDF